MGLSATGSYRKTPSWRSLSHDSLYILVLCCDRLGLRDYCNERESAQVKASLPSDLKLAILTRGLAPRN